MRRWPVIAAASLAVLALAGGARADVIQRGNLRVSFDGNIAPKRLPRSRAVPVRVTVEARVAAVKAATPPQLRRISLAINRYGHFDPRGLPTCRVRDIQPSTTAKALEACGSSLVGKGSFSAKVVLGRQVPFPASGKLYAFNGTFEGRRAILAHVYGTEPVPTSFTLPFLVEPSKGTFGTVLRASLPEATGASGYVTGLSLTLGRTFRSHGEVHSYLSASCPAPKGFPGATFPFAKASFRFPGRTVSATLTRGCKVRR